MSKAFTKDDAAAEPVLVPPRAELPVGTRNYVTARGLARLETEKRGLELERQALISSLQEERPAALAALTARLALLAERLGTAEVVSVAPGSEVVRFGALVRLRFDSGVEAHYRLVGVDEAEPASGRISFAAPLGRVLLGRRVGEVVLLRVPAGEEELEILTIDTEPEPIDSRDRG